MWQVKIVFDKRKYLEKWVHVFCQILETPGSICGSPTLQADSLLSEDQESSILERSSLTRQILNHIQGNILMETQWSTVFIFEKWKHIRSSRGGKKKQKTKNYNHTFLILIYGRILDVAVYIRDVNWVSKKAKIQKTETFPLGFLFVYTNLHYTQTKF